MKRWHDAVHDATQSSSSRSIGWTVGLLLFFPILWTILTSFKTEGEAIASPPSFLFFDWTLENYVEVQEPLELLQALRRTR